MLLGAQPEQGNPAPVRCGLDQIVAVARVNLLGQRVEPCVFGRIGDLARAETLTAETAFGIRLEVVIPRWVLLPAEV